MNSLLALRKPDISLITIYVLILVLFVTILRTGLYKEKEKVIFEDVAIYYVYLPITFIHHDYTAVSVDRKANHLICTHPTSIGKRAVKYSMGMALLYSPFFFIAHMYSHMFGLDTSGYSAQYQLALQLSSLFYLAIGLFFLRKILLKYYDQLVVTITLIVMVLGTNLLQYSTYMAPMSHAYSFALFSIFIYLTIVWHANPSYQTSIFIGLIFGLIVLVRPPNAIIILVFILYNVSSVAEAKKKLFFFFKQYKQRIVIVLFAILVWVPQLLYWKSVTGSFFYYTYRDEGFFFSNPQIYRGLFSYRNGWLTYTPLMVGGLIGIFMLLKRHREFFVPILTFTIINIYIILSWWCWWYVGYGNRAFIESYALLSIPLATFLSWVFSKKVLKFIIVPTIAFLVFLNSFMVWQFNNSMGHYDSMTKEAYWKYFLKIDRSGKIWKYIQHPDYSKSKQGNYNTTENEK